MEDREIPDDQQAVLQTLLGAREGSQLPDDIVSRYWELKRCYDRVSAYITERELAQLVFLCGYGKPIGDEGVENMWDQFRKKLIPHGTPVEVLWRSKWRRASLIGTTADKKLMVQIDGEEEERELDAAHVRRSKSKQPEPETAGV